MEEHHGHSTGSTSPHALLYRRPLDRGGWISQPIHSASSRPTEGLDPITGPKDRIAIYDTGGPFIAMPDSLKTREEMVAWMTRELPKLTTEAGNP